MAKAVINLQKESGGITKISSADGTGVTELVVPESGNLVSVDTAVTDNAIARHDGTTGKLQDSGVIIDDNNYMYFGNGTSIAAETTKNVKYSVIYMMMLKGMQEQQAIINDLKARIEVLEAK